MPTVASEQLASYGGKAGFEPPLCSWPTPGVRKTKTALNI
jgi:hypothetical protein